MALGLTILGLSNLEGNSPLLPNSVAYDTIELYGGGIFDDLWGRNEIIPESEILEYTTTTYLPIWTSTTYILGQFEHTLAMGNVSGITAPLESWLVYRKDPNRSSLRLVAELDKDIISYKDYQPVLGNSYTYWIYAKTANELSNPLVSESLVPDYYGHFLIDVDNSVSYKFELDGTTSSFDTASDFTEYSTNLEYNSFSIGRRKFKEGSIRAIVRDEECSDIAEVAQTIELLDMLEEFITRTKTTKYLKTRRGELYKVFTYGYSQSQLSDNILQQVYISSFNFKENGDVYDN